ncbi:MAG: hypothetical protein JW883_00530 [Deltaproteobacteria bacterium]|nr:hypothetical protein [Deltaproteobacteria bacterium]
MKRGRLYTIRELDAEGRTVSVEPTEYLLKLPHRAAIDEMKVHVNRLATELRQSSEVDDIETPDGFKKTTRLLYQLEVAQKYLTHLRETYAAKGSRRMLG